MNNKEKLEKAIAYVRENKTWTDSEEMVALDRMTLDKWSLDYACKDIDIAISELMDEWGEENGEESGWWEDYIYTDEIFMRL